MKTVKIQLIATIEISEDFDINDLALTQYYADGLDVENFLPSSEDFRVVDYIETTVVE